MSFCPSCGTPQTPGFTACPGCGAPAAPAAPPPAAPAAAPQFVDAPSPANGAFNPGYYGNVPLPAVSPLAIILSAGSWVVGGPLLSLPGLFVARSDIRGIREGRYNPDGLSQSQLAFWIAAVNVGLFCLICFAAIGFILLAGGIGAFSAAHRSSRSTPVPISSTEFAGKSNSQIISEISERISKKGSAEQALWKDVQTEWEAMQKLRAGAPPADAGRMNQLLDKVKSDTRLWSLLVEGERRVWAVTGKPGPTRAPAEAPEGSSHRDW